LGWIRELKKDGKIRHIVRNAFDLNPASSYDIVNDKYATYEVLSNNEVNVLKHYIIFNPNGREEFAKDLQLEVHEILSKINGKAVVKANTSSEGKEVYMVSFEKEAIDVIQDIFNRNFLSVSICPFEEIEAEYRAVYLDGEIIYIYKKIASRMET
jgi:glutathione synthase/RimK-type ligase-like ATP-grasp enzyme